jgi:hypothetical protein
VISPISDTLFDEIRIRDLPKSWRELVHEETEGRSRILSGDVVVFQPLVPLCEDGNIHSLLTFDHLENHALFSQFVTNLEAILPFLRDPRDDVHTPIFAC